MTIYVDGDACPVKKLIIENASKYNIKVIIVLSICHISKEELDTQYIIVDNMSQSVDMMIMNKAQKNDIVVTDDFGLASLVLMKGVYCLSSRGLIYTLNNIDQLISRRHINMKIMKGGGKIKGPTKRNKKDDTQFIMSLNKVIKQSLNHSHE